LTFRIYGAFGTIRDLFIFVKVGARFPRPHLAGVFSDILLALEVRIPLNLLGIIFAYLYIGVIA
jgi:hypothetical protein